MLHIVRCVGANSCCACERRSVSFVVYLICTLAPQMYLHLKFPTALQCCWRVRELPVLRQQRLRDVLTFLSVPQALGPAFHIMQYVSVFCQTTATSGFTKGCHGDGGYITQSPVSFCSSEAPPNRRADSRSETSCCWTTATCLPSAPVCWIKSAAAMKHGCSLWDERGEEKKPSISFLDRTSQQRTVVFSVCEGRRGWCDFDVVFHYSLLPLELQDEPMFVLLPLLLNITPALKSTTYPQAWLEPQEQGEQRPNPGVSTE